MMKIKDYWELYCVLVDKVRVAQTDLVENVEIVSIMAFIGACRWPA